MSAEASLKELGIILADLPTPKGNYLPGTVHHGVMYLSGQGPILENGEHACGIVGREFTLEKANGHARRTGLILFSSAHSLPGSLDRIDRVLNVYGTVNAADDLLDYPKVINGCSDLMVEVFGEAGRHAGAAVGMGTLPNRISVEITAILAVKP